MSPRLLFADPLAAQDVLTFAGRAARLTEDAVRLQGRAGTLVLTAAPLAPRGLLDATPTVLAMRAVAVDPELVCDLVIDAAQLSRDPDDPRAVALPDTAVTAAWSGVAPPRSGWAPLASLTAATLAERAQWGIAAVAHAMPDSPGEEVVRTVRASVWGEPDDALDSLPRGAAFAAYAMGFIAGEETAQVYQADRWTRITLARGHVLVRGPVRTGMTDVRRTG